MGSRYRTKSPHTLCTIFGIFVAGVSLVLGTLTMTTPATARGEHLPAGFVMPKSLKSGGTRSKGEGAETDDERSRRPRWYLPRVALGGGIGIPDLGHLEGFLLFGRYVAVRAFVMPQVPFKIRVEMPSDVIAAKQALAVANPAFNVNFSGRYGEGYGADLMIFPFGGSFFVGAGMSYRQLSLAGHAQSPVLACSLIEAAKEPPCGDPKARIQSSIELVLDAQLRTASMLSRLSFGGLWDLGEYGYFATTVGWALPSNIRRSSNAVANLSVPSSSPPEITGALADLKGEKEADLKAKALKEAEPFDKKSLPILAFSAGVRL